MIRVSDLITIASRLTSIPAEDIKGKSQVRSLALIRAAIVFVARSNHPEFHSFPTIGERLGGRDHSTIINLWKNQDVYAEAYDQYLAFRDELDRLANHLGPMISPDWMPERTFQIKVKPISEASNIERKLRKQALQAMSREKNRDAINARKREARAKAKAQGRALDRFHSRGDLAREEPGIDAYITMAELRYRRQMERSSTRFLNALLAA